MDSRSSVGGSSLRSLAMLLIERFSPSSSPSPIMSKSEAGSPPDVAVATAHRPRSTSEHLERHFSRRGRKRAIELGEILSSEMNAERASILPHVFGVGALGDGHEIRLPHHPGKSHLRRRRLSPVRDADERSVFEKTALMDR